MSPRAPAPPRSPLVRWGIPLALLAIVAVLGVASLSGGDRAGAGGSAAPEQRAADPAASSPRAASPAETSPTEPALARLARRQQDDPLALGPADAPVVMVEYADFQCPFCGRFARETQPRLVDEYVRRGRLRIEWRDLPYLGPDSFRAALAGRAAAAQGRFWAFHHAVYAKERPVNGGSLDDQGLRAIARSAGLDLQRYDRDRRAARARQAMRRDLDEGTGLGITSTPAFVINGTPVIGAQPYAAFRSVIDGALERARSSAG